MTRRSLGLYLAAALALTISAARSPAQTADDFFDDRVVHEIRLTIHPADWQRLRSNFLENTYYPCDMQWRGIRVNEIGIRSRGLGSRSGVKPGLRVDFDRYEAGQQFLGLRSFILRNNVQDASMLHERVSMLLFRRMGLLAPREAHARLYINGQYFGLYTIVESVDKAFLKRNLGEDGGYLYEYEWSAPYRLEYRGSDPSRYSPAPFKPETHESNPNPAPIEAMIRTINQAPDGDFQRAVAEFLDLRLFLAHVAVENFLSDYDGFLGYEGMNNFYMYRFDRRNLNQLIAWDKSEAFNDVGYPIFARVNENVLMRRAMTFPELRNTYLEMLAQAAVLAGGPGGWLDQEIARQYNQIRTSAYEDPNKQCGGRTCTNEEFEIAVARVREYAQIRAEFVLAEVAAAGFASAQDAPRINEGGAVNAASNLGRVLAPGSLVSLYGQGLADATAAAASLPLPTTLAGVSVSVNGFTAPLLYVSPTQINLQVPWEIEPGSASIAVLRNGTLGNLVTARLGPFSPGIFALVHADGALVSPARPAAAEDVLVLYANGLGPVTGAVGTGRPAPFDPLSATVEIPTITIGNRPAEVLFSGLTPGFVGLYQVNLRVPAGVAAGSSTLAVGIGGEQAPAAAIPTR